MADRRLKGNGYGLADGNGRRNLYRIGLDENLARYAQNEGAGFFRDGIYGDGSGRGIGPRTSAEIGLVRGYGNGYRSHNKITTGGTTYGDRNGNGKGRGDWQFHSKLKTTAIGSCIAVNDLPSTISVDDVLLLALSGKA